MTNRLITALSLILASISAAAQAPITEQPAGKARYYDREEWGWYIYAGGNNLQYGRVPGASTLVWADDGYVYILNPLTADSHDSWLRCSVDGNRLTAQLPQVIATLEDSEGSRPLYIGRMEGFTDDNGFSYRPVTTDDYVIWTINDDGTITMDHDPVTLSSDGKFTSTPPTDVLGTYYYAINSKGEQEDVWNGVADWAQTYTPVLTQEYTVIPDGLRREAWQMQSRATRRVVEVAFDGNDVYIGGITPYAPGAVKGTLEGNVLTLPTNQYLGFNQDKNCNVWFLTSNAVYIVYDFGDVQKEYLSRFDRTECMTLTFDPETRTLTAPSLACILINASTGETNYFEYHVDPAFHYLRTEGQDAAPATPVVTVVGDDQGYAGYYYEVDLPTVNVNGVELNTDNLYYNVYVNGQLYTFNPDMYVKLKEPLTDIPYSFTDNFDIAPKGSLHGIYFHAEGIDNIGVQLCLRGSDGFTYRSPLVNSVWDFVPDEADSAPLPPEFVAGGVNMGDDGYYISFRLPAENIQGLPLATSRISYRVRVNDTDHVFTTDNYQKISADMAEVPYGFTDSWDFEALKPGGLHGLFIHSSKPVKSVAVQSVYHSADGRGFASDWVIGNNDNNALLNAEPLKPEIACQGSTLTLCILPANVKGVTLPQEKLYCNFYVNGELYTFSPDQYTGIDAPITDVPCNFADGVDFRSIAMDGPDAESSRVTLWHQYSWLVNIHEKDVRSVGVVTCYRGSDGVIYRSPMASCVMPAADTPALTFGYVPRDAECEPSGSGLAETYDVAIALTNPALVGKIIDHIDVPVIPSAKVSGLKVWTARELRYRIVNGLTSNAVDNEWSAAMPAPDGNNIQWVSVPVTPTEIPDGGLYVGYSLTVDAVDRTDATQVPIVTALDPKEGAFWLRTSRSYLNWADRSSQLGVSAMIQVGLRGQAENVGATIGDIPFSYAALGKDLTVSVPVYNIGTDPITSITYSCAVGDVSVERTSVLNAPIPAMYAYCDKVPMMVNAFDHLGDFSYTITITGVNEQPNSVESSSIGEVSVLSFVPKHLALVEEFTGLWCGWCPRGFVAMEKMNELYPDFCGIAYHDSDPMAMCGGYPEMNDGFPEAMVSRRLLTDAYEATGQSDIFSMPQVWEQYCGEITPVGIEVQAEMDADGIVTASTEVEWALPAEDGSYRVEYVLVADDLYSTDPSSPWIQKNYYAGYKPVPYMDFFRSQGQYVPGLHFNDVAIMTSGFRGVPGSITSSETGYRNSHTYRFDTTQALNVDGKLIPFHADKLRVIAFVLKDNDSFGTVVNTAKCNVIVNDAGVDAVSADTRTIESIEYHDLQGRPLPAPTGLHIRTIRYSDGSSKSQIATH